MDDEDQRILNLLEELTDYTIRLSRVEEDPAIDIVHLTNMCRTQLHELQKIRPGNLARSNKIGGGSKGEQDRNESIIEALKKLDFHTKQCLEVLLRCKSRTENELATLRQTGKAIRAYAGAI